MGGGLGGGSSVVSKFDSLPLGLVSEGPFIFFRFDEFEGTAGLLDRVRSTGIMSARRIGGCLLEELMVSKRLFILEGTGFSAFQDVFEGACMFFKFDDFTGTGFSPSEQ